MAIMMRMYLGLSLSLESKEVGRRAQRKVYLSSDT